VSEHRASALDLVFYDTETTGISTAFDQILQFAAIRTDSRLREIERFEIRCRLMPHIVPAPGAMRVTKITPTQLDDPSYPSHYEMVRALRAKLLAWSPAVFIGYNSLSFDEQLLRQAFFQTLHDPYLTNRGGNARADLMRAVQASTLLAPNTLALPLSDKGLPQFKLDRLAPANGFTHAKAHDAMGDVEATLYLARLLASRAPALWAATLKGATKAGATQLMTEAPIFCAFESYFAKAYGFALTALGTRRDNSTNLYAYDLLVPPDELASLSDSALARRLGAIPRPLRLIKTNGAPILMAYPDAHGLTSAAEIAPRELEARATRLATDAQLRKRLIGAHEALLEPPTASKHVEEQIYDGFISNADQKILEAFHESPWERRAELLDKLSDRRLRQLGRRLLFLERPDLIAGRSRAAQARKMAERLLDSADDVPWLTLHKALVELDAILASATASELPFLCAHRTWLAERLKAAQAIVPQERQASA
jgi:exodeoxyribonuclease-1